MPTATKQVTPFNDWRHACDVSDKDITLRTALACCTVRLSPETFMLVRDGKMKKGDVLAVAQVAGIMAAKKNSELIPMCHPIALTGVDIDFELNEADSSILITSSVRCKGETGVEMEADSSIRCCAYRI
jgi:cyclic pyranopterin phosphate synthase